MAFLEQTALNDQTSHSDRAGVANPIHRANRPVVSAANAAVLGFLVTMAIPRPLSAAIAIDEAGSSWHDDADDTEDTITVKITGLAEGEKVIVCVWREDVDPPNAAFQQTLTSPNGANADGELTVFIRPKAGKSFMGNDWVLISKVPPQDNLPPLQVAKAKLKNLVGGGGLDIQPDCGLGRVAGPTACEACATVFLSAAVPAGSTWGLLVMALFMLSGASIVAARRTIKYSLA